MKTTTHTPEQIIKILEQAEKGEQAITAVCREHGMSENTFYRWRKAYGGMSVNEAQRLKEREKEHSRLTRLLAERMRENDLLKELLGKKACVWSSSAKRCIFFSLVACPCRARARCSRFHARRSCMRPNPRMTRSWWARCASLSPVIHATATAV